MDMKEIKPLSAALATPLDEPIGPPPITDHSQLDHAESGLVHSPVQQVNQPVDSGFYQEAPNEANHKNKINHVTNSGSDQWVSQNSNYQKQEVPHQGHNVSGHQISAQQVSGHHVSGHQISSHSGHQTFIQPIHDNDVVMKHSHAPNDLMVHSPQVVNQNQNQMSQVVKNEPIVTQSTTVLTGEQIKMALKNGCRIMDSNGVEVSLGSVSYFTLNILTNYPLN